MAIYGVIVAIILSTRLESPFAVRDSQTGLFPIQAMTAGYAIYGSGVTTGWSNLVCGCIPWLFTEENVRKQFCIVPGGYCAQGHLKNKCSPLGSYCGGLQRLFILSEAELCLAGDTYVLQALRGDCWQQCGAV